MRWTQNDTKTKVIFESGESEIKIFDYSWVYPQVQAINNENHNIKTINVTFMPKANSFISHYSVYICIPEYSLTFSSCDANLCSPEMVRCFLICETFALVFLHLFFQSQLNEMEFTDWIYSEMGHLWRTVRISKPTAVYQC